MTVAAFMDLALYDPDLGYYARSARRSGRAGDFFTSVDVGPLFGELLEAQLAEMYELLGTRGVPDPACDLVEAGAGDGRLSADILRAARQRDRQLYDRIHLHLIEVSPQARRAQRAVLGDVAERLYSAGTSLPESFEGVLLANELLDALPVHQVVMREGGLREVYVTPGVTRELRTVEGPPSTPALARYLDRAGITLEAGWRAEINLAAIEWIRDAARRQRRGFMIIIDYGHRARELYSVTHSSGTLTAFTGHRSHGPESGTPIWLDRPGDQDITAHVDFTGIIEAAEVEGMQNLGFLDQTYFVMGVLPSVVDPQSPPGMARSALRRLKTLIMPGGLGSALKVLILGKHVGTPALIGCSYRVRVT
jgi:SAM-dependent MidA family methyltransferase